MNIYINGRIVDEADAKISVFDSGFMHGDGLFETMRAYSGTIFALDRHLDRLFAALRTLEYKGVPNKKGLSDACQAVLKANDLPNARVRLTVTRGIPGESAATVVITAVPFAGYPEDFYKTGMCAITLPGYRCSNSLLSALKSTSHLASMLARNEAVSQGCDEAILLNEHGDITEGSYTNIFAVKDGKLYTPPVKEGLLPGITREIIIEIANREDYHLQQQHIRVDELFTMDELFLTNSLMEVMPLTEVDGNPIGDGKPGKITQEIMHLYKKQF